MFYHHKDNIHYKVINIISGEEVVIATGDLYYAKNVISNEKRMISIDTINQFHAKNEAITETSKKTLLRG